MTDKTSLSELLHRSAGPDERCDVRFDVLESNVRHQLCRKRRHRKVRVVAMFGVAVMTVALVWIRPGQPSRDSDPLTARTSDERHNQRETSVSPRTIANTALRRSVNESIQRSERLERTLSASVNFESVTALKLDDRMHQTAMIIWARAERKALTPALRASALEDFHRLVELAPRSPLADRARKRIESLSNPKNQKRSHRDQCVAVGLVSL